MNNENLSEDILFMRTGCRETMDAAASAGMGMSMPFTAASKIIYYVLSLYYGHSDTPGQHMQIPGKPSGYAPGKACSRGEEKTGRKYRTKGTAGQKDEVPAYLPVITNKKYRDAMTFNTNSSAFLQLLTDSSRLAYKNGSSTVKGFPATFEKIQEYCTDEGIAEINIPLLAMLYGILLRKFLPSPETHSLNETAAVYYPSLAKMAGKSNTGVKDIEAFKKAMEKLENIVGIVDNGQKGSDIIPVISGYKYDKATNTVRFASPYIARIIQEIHKTSIRKDKNNEPVKDKNGNMQMMPSYSYLIDSSIEKERNKKNG